MDFSKWIETLKVWLGTLSHGVWDMHITELHRALCHQPDETGAVSRDIQAVCQTRSYWDGSSKPLLLAGGAAPSQEGW